MDTTGCGTGDTPATLNCISTLLPSIIAGAFYLVGITTVIFIILAGIKFISSNGDNKQIEGAKKTLTYAIIGLVIVLSAVFIISVISKVTGVDCIASFTFNGCSK